MDDLQARFTRAAEAVQKLPRRPNDDTLLRLYALYKQASVGDAGGRRPGFLDPVGRAKYDAWSELRGTSAELAMQQYVALVERLREEQS